jgi:uncharacterized protein (DUF697 family)
VDAGQVLLLALVFLCLVPIAIMVGLVIFLVSFGKQQLENLSSPDVESLVAEYRTAAARDPHNREAIVDKIIRRQAFRCGLVGFVTGLGGFFTLPIALPIDILLSVRLQATMVKFLATVYGFENSYDSRVATYMIMSGSSEVSSMSAKFILRMILRLIGESFSRFVPFLGAIISALVNYLLARSTGYVLKAWYARKLQASAAA